MNIGVLKTGAEIVRGSGGIGSGKNEEMERE
jgi:hypothetical protein